jgi:hypothetical protein
MGAVGKRRKQEVNPMWDMTVPVIGRCRECGDELGAEVVVRATQEWVDQYQSDDRMRRVIDQAVVRLVVARHERHCLGRVPQRLALAAASA